MEFRTDVLCVYVFVVGSKGLLFDTRLLARTTPVMLTALTTPTHTHTHTHSTAPRGLSIFASRKHIRRREGGKEKKNVTLYRAGVS